MIIVKNCTTSVFFPLWAVTNRSRHSKFSTRLFAIEESVHQNVKAHTPQMISFSFTPIIHQAHFGTSARNLPLC